MELELNYDDSFKFPPEISWLEFEGSILVVSETTANWIVLCNTVQLAFLLRLKAGETIGQILDSLDSEESSRDFVRVLQCVAARKFAGKDEEPKGTVLDSSKMINLYLTNSCNLRCKHCFMNAGTPNEDELTAEEWKRVLDEFKESGGENATFSGGEPLMRSDFDEILAHAHKIGLKATILSNGLLWTKERIERLSPCITEIQLSLDGVDEASNSIVRGKGGFDKVQETALLFCKSGVRVSISTTFTLETLAEGTAKRYAEMRERINSLTDGAVFFKLSKKLLSGRGRSLTQEQQSGFSKEIKDIERLSDPNADTENFIEGHLPNLVSDNCGFGGISISSTGDVYYCNRILEVEKFGSVREDQVSKFVELGKEIHQSTSVENVEPCKSCNIRNICGGGCRIDDFNFRGRIKDFQGRYRQVVCDEGYKRKILKRMVDSFNYLYTFD